MIRRDLIVYILRRYARGPDALDNNVGEVVDPVCHDPECKTPKSDIPMSRRSWIDADYTDDTVNPKVGIFITYELYKHHVDSPPCVIIGHKWCKDG